jgi:single-strand DNA-binding protein
VAKITDLFFKESKIVIKSFSSEVCEMSGLNCCQFIGNLGGDPEMRFTPAGNPVTTFNLACNRVFVNNEGARQEETEWLNIITWNKLAQSCNQFLVKGAQVYVEGRLHTRSWDGQDGQKHYRTEIIASNVIFLNKRTGEERSQEPEKEDIPF